MKMWSGRFRKPLDSAFENWQRSFPFDQRLVGQEVAASSAHARALHGLGILSEAELASVLDGLKQIGRQWAEAPASAADNVEIEDVHHFVEASLLNLMGEAGAKLHSGRSRNEQIATDLRLYVRDKIDETLGLLSGWMLALLHQARTAGHTTMPVYTHLQPAEPVLVAHWLLAYVEMFLRDAGRLIDCRRRLNLCPLGSGAAAGSILALDRRAMAADLGFEAPTRNSIDATSDRDFAIEFVNSLTLIHLHLSRWAEEMILYSTREFGFVILSESFATGSSAMPQKKNPDALELIRGKAARSLGNAVALQVTLKSLPLAYNKDMQETQEPVFAAAESITGLLPIVTAMLKEVEFDYERMRDASEVGFLNALAAAGYLMRRGTPFRRAHEQVGKAVRLCLEEQCELQHLSLAQLQQFGDFDQDFHNAMRLEEVLAGYDVQGGTAPVRVQEALAEAEHNIMALKGQAYAHA